ncbi:hypothetical protein CEXT_120881 [Caerostris extrusa]|uniref:Uncharacterized protein n=1 Tax=Caerostris extrusa TaxID=172846 RepID=A0AAV4TL91_CAEEX|nr:hypothetical protein CEXT_120881 [Caerostris extrusa]
MGPGAQRRALLTHAMLQHLALCSRDPLSPTALSRLPKSSAVTRPQEWANDLLLFFLVVVWSSKRSFLVLTATLKRLKRLCIVT